MSPDDAVFEEVRRLVRERDTYKAYKAMYEAVAESRDELARMFHAVVAQRDQARAERDTANAAASFQRTRL